MPPHCESGHDFVKSLTSIISAKSVPKPKEHQNDFFFGKVAYLAKSVFSDFHKKTVGWNGKILQNVMGVCLRCFSETKNKKRETKMKHFTKGTIDMLFIFVVP